MCAYGLVLKSIYINKKEVQVYSLVSMNLLKKKELFLYIIINLKDKQNEVKYVDNFIVLIIQVFNFNFYFVWF